MRRPPKREVQIEMTPFLDSLMIMMSLICLVLIIMIIPVIQNPGQLSVLSFRELEMKMKSTVPRPFYIDCHPEGAVVVPGDQKVTIEQMMMKGNPVFALLDRVETNRNQECIILLARPDSLPVFRHLRRELERRKITYGSDILASDAVLNWREKMNELNISRSSYF